ncbi:MAG TPA: hypothetical protein QGG70_01145, partial [Candidatus Pacearchaeota archaeon]|nr:hypothetical protein [Candidatus Pacearchaeota archaeon]
MKIKHKFFGIFAILCLMLSLGVVVAQVETIFVDDINSVKDNPGERDKIFTRVSGGIEFKGFSESWAILTE